MSERVAIVGSRDFPDLDAVRRYVAGLPEGTLVVSGGARGVDRTAANAALARGLNVEEYLAEWDKHGKAAGYLRNHSIVAVSDRVVAFWDGKSRGTQHTIRLAREKGKPVDVRLWPCPGCWARDLSGEAMPWTCPACGRVVVAVVKLEGPDVTVSMPAQHSVIRTLRDPDDA